MERRVTPEELAEHSSTDDCWTVVHGKVYDVTGYLQDHPGGVKLLARNGGKDSTSDFEGMFHSKRARALLKSMLVGVYQDSSKSEKATLSPSSAYDVKPASGQLSGQLSGSQHNSVAIPGQKSTTAYSRAQDPEHMARQQARLDQLSKAWKSDTEAKPSASSSTAPALTVNSAAAHAVISPKHWTAYPIMCITQANSDACVFRFALPRKDATLPWAPSQHVRLCVPHADAGSKPEASAQSLVFRSYTPVSTQPGSFDLLVKRYDTNGVSQALHGLRVGQRAWLKGMFGTYRYEHNTHKHILAVCCGTGITPIYQVLDMIHKAGAEDTTKWDLVYGNRTWDSVLLRDEITAMTVPNERRVHHALSRMTAEEVQSLEGAVSGHVTLDMLKAAGASQCDQVLLCGTTGFIDMVNTLLTQLGVAEDVRHEF